jgi:hypothetical protein
MAARGTVGAMTLPVPAYVQIDTLRQPALRFFWDDWNIEAVDMPVDAALEARLASMSQRATAAFSIAACEWVLFRFSHLTSDVLPRQYLEAAWAQLCDFHYATHFDIDPDQWRGPVRGPVGTAIRRVKFALRQADIEGNPAWSAARLSRLVAHVLPDAAPYLQWRDIIIDRFVQLYPFDKEDSLGDPVPWQFADPAWTPVTADAENLLATFIHGLATGGNPFMNAPDVMVAQGFKGRPYEFSLAEDRRARWDW